MTNGQQIKNDVLRWIHSLRVEGQPGRYRVCRDGNASLLTSCAVIFTYDLLGELGQMSAEEREALVGFIQGQQSQETGYFSENNVAQENLHGGWEHNYLVEESTKFSLHALAALGAEPLYPFAFLETDKHGDNLLQWLKSLDWREPWYQSNKVMFKLSLLIDDHERNGTQQSLDCVHAVLDWLNSWQDPQTGVWGTDHGVPLYHGVFTAFHFLFFYAYLKRPLQYIPKLINSALSIQNRKDGLFSPHGGGGACPDLDAVDILVKCSQMTDYRSQDVKRALERCFQGLVNNQDSEGGFCWARKRTFTPGEWIRSYPNFRNSMARSRGLYTAYLYLFRTHFLPRGFEIQYSGWDYLKYYSAESDIFSTWFRLLTIALIESWCPQEVQTGISWNFPNKAMIGWHRPLQGKRI